MSRNPVLLTNTRTHLPHLRCVNCTSFFVRNQTEFGWYWRCCDCGFGDNNGALNEGCSFCYRESETPTYSSIQKSPFYRHIDRPMIPTRPTTPTKPTTRASKCDVDYHSDFDYDSDSDTDGDVDATNRILRFDDFKIEFVFSFFPNTEARLHRNNLRFEQLLTEDPGSPECSEDFSAVDDDSGGDATAFTTTCSDVKSPFTPLTNSGDTRQERQAAAFLEFLQLFGRRISTKIQENLAGKIIAFAGTDVGENSTWTGADSGYGSVSINQNGGLTSQKRGNDEKDDETSKNPDEDDETGCGGSSKRARKTPSTKLRLACPFYENNRRKCKLPSCSGPGASDIHRLKDHLYKHAVYQCNRCSKSFRGTQGMHQLKEHERNTQPCELRPLLPAWGLSQTAMIHFKSRKSVKGDTIEEQWRYIYRYLFPETSAMSVPSPYVCEDDAESEYGCSLSAATSLQKQTFDHCVSELTRLLPPRLSASFKDHVDNETLNEAWDRFAQDELANVVRDAVCDIPDFPQPALPDLKPNHDGGTQNVFVEGGSGGAMQLPKTSTDCAAGWDPELINFETLLDETFAELPDDVLQFTDYFTNEQPVLDFQSSDLRIDPSQVSSTEVDAVEPTLDSTQPDASLMIANGGTDMGKFDFFDLDE